MLLYCSQVAPLNLVALTLFSLGKELEGRDHPSQGNCPDRERCPLPAVEWRFRQTYPNRSRGKMNPSGRSPQCLASVSCQYYYIVLIITIYTHSFFLCANWPVTSVTFPAQRPHPMSPNSYDGNMVTIMAARGSGGNLLGKAPKTAPFLTRPLHASSWPSPLKLALHL